MQMLITRQRKMPCVFNEPSMPAGNCITSMVLTNQFSLATLHVELKSIRGHDPLNMSKDIKNKSIKSNGIQRGQGNGKIVNPGN